MSADNGVYILVTEGPEYRVAHLQDIEQVWWNDVTSRPTQDRDIHIANARRLWADRPFTTEGEALQKAWQILNELTVCEYGIGKIEIPRRF